MICRREPAAHTALPFFQGFLRLVRKKALVWELVNYGKGILIVIMHFAAYPYQQDISNVKEEELQGEKFKDWEKNANYFVRETIILQIDTTNVSPGEKQIAPNITFISNNQAIINIYKTWGYRGISFSEFKDYAAKRDAALQRYVQELTERLNAARAESGRYGNWYVNYGLNDRKIEISKPAD